MSWQSGLALVVSGSALMGYYFYERNRLLKEKENNKTESYGKPKVGGPFTLVDHFGVPVTDADYRGKYMLIYFGYTFCPDVCPEELDKMAEIVDACHAKGFGTDIMVPLFISCDPKRDSVSGIKEYLKGYTINVEFHPKFVGLTGTYQQIKRVAKAYRLYFSAPPKALDDDEDDYLVDHSIFFYLMGPDGQYIEHFGRIDPVEKVVERVVEHIQGNKAL